MSIEDRVREAVERALLRLREEFDGHRQQLTDSVNGILAEEQTAWRSHLEGAVEDARRDADREADARVDAAREQLRKESEEQIAAARAHAQREIAEQVAAAREQAHREASDQVNAAREQVRHEAADQIRAAREEAQREAAEHANAAREQAQREAAEHVNAAREQAQRDIQVHVDAARQLAAQHAAAQQEATTSASAAGGEVVSRVLGAVRHISDAQSLRAVLEALAAGVRSEAARVALLLVDHDRLTPWASFGFDAGQEPTEVDVQTVPAIRSAIADRKVLPLPAADASAAPVFLHAAAGRNVRIFPLVVGGNVVAVVCGESDAASAGDAAPAWSQAIEVLVQYASLRLENLTSLRTVEALTTAG